MKDKFHKLIFLSLLVPILSTSHASEVSIGDVGPCYDSLESYMSKAFGSDYTDDDNIKFEEVESLTTKSIAKTRNRYYWVYDQTAGVNITRTLFERNHSGKFCAILQIPLSSGNNFHLKDDGSLPSFVESTDSPPPDFPGTRVVFKLDRATHVYTIKECFRSKNGRETKVRCKKIFAN